MKSYISSGRTEVQNLEVDALEHQPPLFHEYGSASLAEKNIMDGQLRDLKTNARLQSKGGWHNWRSQLLSDLKTGLLQTSRDLDQDDRLISQIEATFQGILPELSLKERSLEEELRMLECRKQDAEENTGAEVEEARRQLQAIEADLKEKGALLTSLKSDLETQQSSVDDARSWKAETIAAIAEADRITEEHRGWSVSEVSSLQDKLSALEEKLGWSLVSASETSVTLAHNDLHLTFNPDSWMTQSHTPDPDAPDSQVLLTYVGRTQDEPSHPRATVHRFFLQLLRAHALSLPQNRTRASTLLAVVSAGWDLASRVDAALAALAVAGVTEACIEGDERVALRFVLLLPSLRTKVHVCFTIDVAIVGEAVDGRVRVSANVVYGEKYDEPKMADFLKKFVQGHVGSMDEIRQWADGVEDLRGRLLRRGRKD
jgi:kinetochore protein Spc7/SPC105